MLFAYLISNSGHELGRRADVFMARMVRDLQALLDRDRTFLMYGQRHPERRGERMIDEVSGQEE